MSGVPSVGMSVILGQIGLVLATVGIWMRRLTRDRGGGSITRRVVFCARFASILCTRA